MYGVWESIKMCIIAVLLIRLMEFFCRNEEFRVRCIGKSRFEMASNGIYVRAFLRLCEN